MAVLHSYTLPILLLLFLIFSSISQATVPANETFKFVNQGEFGEYITEYYGDYRPLSVYTSPFQLCFYNVTPNAFTLALRMGTTRSESLRRWVWEANRGNPVDEGATFALGRNGNLVLARSDGRVVWQTGTANKGVVGLKVLPNGNMVLYNSNNKYVWQSFNSPTDTLLVGQSLKLGATTRLVSRASEKKNVDGPYSLVVEPKGLSMYYKPKNSSKPLLYFSSFPDWFNISKGSSIENVTFTVQNEYDSGYAYTLSLDLGIANSLNNDGRILTRPKYDSTLSMLRLEIDGNIKIYTYDDNVDWGAWEETYSLFSREDIDMSECQLPGRCGEFGLCEDSQCVACPTPNGLMGWSKNCVSPKVSSCAQKDFHYYKLEGVDHFLTKYTRGDGPVKESGCKIKCTKDCKCMGYFYQQDTSRCWITYDLKTLTRVENSKHLGFIKVPNH